MPTVPLNVVSLPPKHGLARLLILSICLQNLISPTKKDFEHLVAFLLRQLDPHWRLLGKLEDDVPAMLAWLKYPFQVTVSARSGVRM